MPAFIATVEGDEGRIGGVYFTPQAIHARRAVCDEYQDGYLSGAEVHRVPSFDKYEKERGVPVWEMLDRGWWTECYHCHQKMTTDELYDENDNEYYMDIMACVGYFDGLHFCCQSCSDAFHYRRAVEQQMKGELLEMMQAKLESKFGTQGIEYPDLEGQASSWNYYGPGYNCQVEWKHEVPCVISARLAFKFPGCKFWMSYTVENKERIDNPEYKMGYHPEDHEAVADFFLERTGRVLDTPTNQD